MKKILTVLFSLCLFLGIAGNVKAVVLNFDDISSFGIVPNGYGGLNWDNFFTNDISHWQWESCGFTSGVVSWPNEAFNSSGFPASISSNTPFTFYDVYFTAATNNGLNIEVQGYRNNVLVYDTNQTFNTDHPTLTSFNYQNIDRLTFIPSGGTPVATHEGNSRTWFVADNFNYEFSQPVPEPATMLLLSSGLVGLVGFGRKKFRKS